MLRLKVNDNLYQVKFYYTNTKGILANDPNREVNGTECSISKNGNLIAKGLSYCSPSDVFIKAIGRKLSLLRASALVGDKGIRTSIWNEYFKLSPKSKRRM
jgi:hypothetical protein